MKQHYVLCGRVLSLKCVNLCTVCKGNISFWEHVLTVNNWVSTEIIYSVNEMLMKETHYVHLFNIVVFIK